MANISYRNALLLVGAVGVRTATTAVAAAAAAATAQRTLHGIRALRSLLGLRAFHHPLQLVDIDAVVVALGVVHVAAHPVRQAVQQLPAADAAEEANRRQEVRPRLAVPRVLEATL